MTRAIGFSVLTAVLALGIPARAVTPNIVMVIADDLDNRTFQAAQQAGLLPNITTYIMQRGTTFSRFYVTDARGCPTRQSFLRGVYFHNLQAVEAGDTACGISLFNDSSTLPVWLKQAGYRTALIGKYLDGYGYTDANKDGKIDWSDTVYIPPGWDHWQGLEYTQPMFSRGGPPPMGVVTLGWDNPNQYNYFLNDRGSLRFYGSAPADYQTDVLNGLLSKYLDQLAVGTGPFFLYLAPGAPHIEVFPDGKLYDEYSDAWSWDCPPSPNYTGSATFDLPAPANFNETDVSDKPTWIQSKPLLTAADIINVNRQFSRRVAALQAVDQLVGTLAAKLAAAGTLDNTVILFLSDNGWQYGNHRLSGKLDAYDESISTPLLVSIGGGITNSAMITAHDIAPTLVELAGASMPYTADGRSFVPLLSDPAQPWRNRVLIEHWTAMLGSSPFDMPDYIAVRTGLGAGQTADQLYVSWSTGEVEFYDYTTDPGAKISRHNALGSARQQQMTSHQQNVRSLQRCGAGTCQILEFAP